MSMDLVPNISAQQGQALGAHRVAYVSRYLGVTLKAGGSSCPVGSLEEYPPTYGLPYSVQLLEFVLLVFSSNPLVMW